MRRTGLIGSRMLEHGTHATLIHQHVLMMAHRDELPKALAFGHIFTWDGMVSLFGRRHHHIQ